MSPDPALESLSAGAPVLVAGGGVTGRAVLAALSRLGATATLCDDDPTTRQYFAETGTATEDSATAAQHIVDYALVVTSPGFPPTAPVPAAAAAAGVPVWGDVELAWRLDQGGHYGPPRRWLTVTGTNGKTTTTSMLHAMLVAAGLDSRLCGNIGSPVLDVLHEPADVLAVELSSFQLHWAPSVRPEAGVVLNIAEDHLDWHATMDDYAAAKAGVLRGRVAVAGLDDPRAAELLAAAPAPVRVGFRLGEPAAGGARRAGRHAGRQSLYLSRLRRPGAGAGLVHPGAGPGGRARRVGSRRAGAQHRSARRRDRDGAGLVRGGPRIEPSWWPSSTRSATSTIPRPRIRMPPRHPCWPTRGWCGSPGVYSKAHRCTTTVARVAPRLVGAVLIGRDRAMVAEALSRHAPDVPVVQVVAGEDIDMHATAESPVAYVTHVVPMSDETVGARVMNAAVAAARDLAQPGDTVLLAPAGASFDQFTGYGDRGDAFAAAVRATTR